MNDAADELIDTSGLLCPLPLLSVKKRLKSIISGSTIQIVTTDASSASDFPLFFSTIGVELLESYSENNQFIFLIRN